MTLISGCRSFQQLRAETSEFFYAGLSQKDACQAHTGLGLLFLVGVALAIWVSPASSAAVPKIEIYPPQLSLQAGETEEVWVKIVNDTGEQIDALELTPTAPRGVQVKVDPLAARTLPPGGEMLTRFTVTASEEEPPKGLVNLVAFYRWPSAKKGQGMALAELKLEAHAPSEPSKLASLELSSAARTLDEYGPGIIYLTVRNIADRPINLDCPQTTHPEFIGVEVNIPSKSQNSKNSQNPSDKCIPGKRLLPGESQIFEMKVTPKDDARAGNHPLLISLKLDWREGGRRTLGTLTANHTIELGILGESTILQLLGIPSFLVLPGFLMLGSWLAIRRRLMDTSATKAEGPEIPTCEFWLIAITLSLFAALVYPKLTGLFGPERNYLRGYGLIDLVYVWTGSILLSAIFAFAKFIWPFLRRKYYEPQFEDTPLVALHKAKRSHASLAQVKVNNDSALYFVYREWGNHTWVAPRILYEFTPDCSIADQDGFRKPLGDSLKKLDNGKPDYNLDKLVELITNAERNEKIKIFWESDKGSGSSVGPICKKGRIDKEDSGLLSPRDHLWPIHESHEK